MSFKLYQICYISLFFLFAFYSLKMYFEIYFGFSEGKSHTGDVNVSKRHVSGKVYIYVRPLLVSMVAVRKSYG